MLLKRLIISNTQLENGIEIELTQKIGGGDKGWRLAREWHCNLQLSETSHSPAMDLEN